MLGKKVSISRIRIRSWINYWKQHQGLMFVAILFFAVATIFLVGENSIFEQIRYSRRISDLRKEIKQRTELFEADSLKLERLIDPSTNLERIAREEYKMKAPEELIFLLVDTTSQKKQ